MILGSGPLSDGAREAFKDVPFTWLLFQSPLPPLAEYLMPLPADELVVVSTPALVGTTTRLMNQYPRFRWAVVPENVRLYHPEDWKTQARFIVGTTSPGAFCQLARFFAPAPCLWMKPESAEMVKHGLNGFLAVSIAYAHDLARVGEQHGADPEEVAFGIMSDPRIGMSAYLRPIGGASQHLYREVDNLLELGAGSVVESAASVDSKVRNILKASKKWESKFSAAEGETKEK